MENKNLPKYQLFIKIEVGLLFLGLLALLFVPYLHSIARYAFWSSLLLLAATFTVRTFVLQPPFDIKTTKKKLGWYLVTNITIWIYPIALFSCLYPISLTLAQIIKIVVVIHLLLILLFSRNHPRNFFIKEALRCLIIIGLTFTCYTYSYNLFCYLYQVREGSEIVKHYQLLESFEKTKNRAAQQQTYAHLKLLLSQHNQ
jgi:hypothetical protein